MIFGGVLCSKSGESKCYYFLYSKLCHGYIYANFSNFLELFSGTHFVNQNSKLEPFDKFGNTFF